MNVDKFHNLEDFSWEKHAYSILYKYTPNYADDLNFESEYLFNMSKNLFGTEQVDTGPFRNSI